MIQNILVCRSSGEDTAEKENLTFSLTVCLIPDLKEPFREDFWKVEGNEDHLSGPHFEDI